ncbi:MAG: ATP-binding protein [Nitrospiraceae bacterium]|nr:ATP-binding protein [Nitrospiraceae bacterium]
MARAGSDKTGAQNLRDRFSGLKPGLLTRLFIFSLAGIFVSIGAVAFLVAGREKALLSSIRNEKSISVAEDVVETVREEMLVRRRPAEILKIVGGRIRGSGIKLAIFKKDGSVYFGPAGARLPAAARPLSAGGAVWSGGYSYNKDGVFAFFRPLINERACWGCHSRADRIRGYVGVFLPGAGLGNGIDRVFGSALLFALLISLASGAGLVLVVKRMLYRELSRESEEKLKALAEKEFSEAIFNSTASGVAVLDENGNILRMNQPGLEILELTGEEAVGKRVDTIDEALADMRYTMPKLSREAVIRTGDGKIKPIGFTSSQLLDQNGGQKGIIVVFRDLTEIKKISDEIRKKQHFEMIGKVIAGVAHEIRNPLFAIQSIGQLLEREIAAAQHQALIQAMLKETRRVKALIEELLSYSRPSRLEMGWIDLHLFFEDLFSYVKLSGYQPQVLFSSTGTAMVKADSDKMRQVFLNLLDNAAGASCKRVEITAERENGMAVITVRDDGQGIKEADMERIFDPFFTTKKEGTGLGLPICRKIVEEHGGRLEIKSAPGEGTTVTVRIP